MLEETITVSAELGDILHQLDELGKREGLSPDDSIAQQILANTIEQTGIVIAQAQKGKSTIAKKVIVLDIQQQHLDAMHMGVIKHSPAEGYYFTLLDDGQSFRVIMCHPGADAAIRVYESESLQPA